MNEMGKMKRAVSVVTGGFLWLVVLVPILGVSAYSLYYIGRYLGAPWYIAIAFSTCFDGVALFAARKSVDYAQAGLSGSFPKFVVRLFALTAAFLQTLHVRINHEPRAAAILWASLPIGAMLVYEMHIRWERRKALARAGVAYPSPLPSFGLMTWVLFPLSTLNKLRDITVARRTALVTVATTVVSDFQAQTAKIRNTRERIAEPVEATASAEVVPEAVVAEHRARRTAPAARTSPATANGNRRPKAGMREWLKAEGHAIGDYGRIPQPLQDLYWKAHPEAGEA
jgi:hypothetical protein